MDRSRLCFKKRLRRPHGGCVKGAGGGNMQITQGSDRSTCHRHPWSCRFITVATSATGHVDRLLWRAALHQTQLLGGGPLCPTLCHSGSPSTWHRGLGRCTANVPEWTSERMAHIGKPAAVLATLKSATLGTRFWNDHLHTGFTHRAQWAIRVMSPNRAPGQPRSQAWPLNVAALPL